MSKNSEDARWAVGPEDFARMADELDRPAEVVPQLVELAEAVRMKRRPGRLACPVCKKEADGQPDFREGQRLFQHFICDTPDCPVGSFRLEWRS